MYFYFKTDLTKLYNSTAFNPDVGPIELQRKVMFDICYHFCRRGGENLDQMTANLETLEPLTFIFISIKKDVFDLRYNVDSGIAYVMKVKDELTKNHKENDSELITGFMPQILNADGTVHKLCPVRSYESYTSHLNTESNWLWQKPLCKFPNDITKPWYEKRKVGKNAHECFMGVLSKLCALSKHYTNHCVRVTGVTNLSRSNFSSKQVMAVSGHKSIQSLEIYQKVDENEKLMMGMCLNYSLLKPQEPIELLNAKENNNKENLLSLPAPHHEPTPVTPSLLEIQPHAIDRAIKNIVNLETALVPLGTPPKVPESEDFNFDLSEIIKEFEGKNDDDKALVLAATQIENQVTTMKTAVYKRGSPQQKQFPTFTNCKFGNIGTLNIHIHKH